MREHGSGDVGVMDLTATKCKTAAQLYSLVPYVGPIFKDLKNPARSPGLLPRPLPMSSLVPKSAGE